jgi:hypothetical protein
MNFAEQLVSNYGLLGLLLAAFVSYFLKKESAFDSERKDAQTELKTILREALACQAQVSSELDALEKLIRERFPLKP